MVGITAAVAVVAALLLLLLVPVIVIIIIMMVAVVVVMVVVMVAATIAMGMVVRSWVRRRPLTPALSPSEGERERIVTCGTQGGARSSLALGYYRLAPTGRQNEPAVAGWVVGCRRREAIGAFVGHFRFDPFWTRRLPGDFGGMSHLSRFSPVSADGRFVRFMADLVRAL